MAIGKWIPSRRQWRRWTLPAKYAAFGLALALLGDVRDEIRYWNSRQSDPQAGNASIRIQDSVQRWKGLEQGVALTANGQTGIVTISPGDTFYYSWSSRGMRYCELVSPTTSGVSASGVSTGIKPGDIEYPLASRPVRLQVDCYDETSQPRTGAVLVRLASM